MAIVAEITTSPLGFFVKAPGALGPPSPVLADNIDPETRDFASLDEGMDPIDAQVQVAVTTQRGSGAAVVEDGIEITTNKMTSAVQNIIEADLRLALRRLARAGDIRIVEVTFDLVSETNQTLQIRASYINLRALDGKIRTVVAPLNVPGKVG